MSKVGATETGVGTAAVLTDGQSEGQPLVSIGLPVYNGERFLARSLASLLEQTYRNVEVILSDNASTDGTAQICKQFVAEDARVRYSRLPHNIGGVGNHQRVRELARGEFFMWASGDDVWLPQYIETCMTVLRQSADVACVYTTNTIIDEQLTVLRTLPAGPDLAAADPAERFSRLTDIYIGIQPFYGVMRTAVVRKVRKLLRHPGFDRIFFAELGLHGRLVRIEQPLYLRCEHAQQSVGAYPSLRSRYLWINPGRTTKLAWPHFGYLAAFLAAALRAAPDMVTRIRCTLRMLRWCSWHRRELLDDLLMRP